MSERIAFMIKYGLGYSSFVYGAFKEISVAVCTAERSNRSEAVCDSLFWKSMYSDRQQAELEKKLCVGNHKTVTCFLPEVFHRRKSSLYLMRLTTKESAGKFLHLKRDSHAIRQE